MDIVYGIKGYSLSSAIRMAANESRERNKKPRKPNNNDYIGPDITMNKRNRQRRKK